MRQLDLIAEFLSEYVDYAGSTVPGSVDPVKDAIAVLLENGVMTIDEMRHEALRDYNVIIPWNLFPKEE